MPSLLPRRVSIGGGVATAIGNLILDPINRATFSLSLIYVLWTILQAIQVIIILCKPRTYKPSFIILLICFAFGLANQIMAAVEVAVDYQLIDTGNGELVTQVSVEPSLPDIFYITWSWVADESNVLLFLALFVHLDHLRVEFHNTFANVGKANDGTTPTIRPWSPSMVIIKRIIDYLPIVVWQVILFAWLGLQVQYFGNPNPNPELPRAPVPVSIRHTLNNLSYTSTAFHVLMPISLLIGAIILCVHSRHFSTSRDQMILLIAFPIATILLVRGFFDMAILIITTPPTVFNTDIDPEVLNLVTTIVPGILWFAAVQVWLIVDWRQAIWRNAIANRNNQNNMNMNQDWNGNQNWNGVGMNNGNWNNNGMMNQGNNWNQNGMNQNNGNWNQSGMNQNNGNWNQNGMNQNNGNWNQNQNAMGPGNNTPLVQTVT